MERKGLECNWLTSGRENAETEKQKVRKKNYLESGFTHQEEAGISIEVSAEIRNRVTMRSEGAAYESGNGGEKGKDQRVV